MKQQTSVEWLFETMAKIPMTDWYEVLQKAKEMEKKQIIDAYNEAYFGDKYKWKGSEEYYNQTFNQ